MINNNIDAINEDPVQKKWFFICIDFLLIEI